MEHSNQGIDLTDAIKKMFDDGAIQVQIYTGSHLLMTVDKNDFINSVAQDESEA